jgi:hypothetical protein
VHWACVVGVPVAVGDAASEATEALAPLPSAKKKKKKGGGGSGPMKVLLTHKGDKHEVEIASPQMTCAEFAELISAQTGIPASGPLLVPTSASTPHVHTIDHF